MDQGYKHFSHSHNLIMHQMPEGIEVSCSGCNSSGTGTLYVCWQCNFFLHEQCYRATRSLKHPSHPNHPLTLVPYPTYPSNSFYCNSCQIIGTGFSYSCADCEFDLHVQCAYSISRATSFKNVHQYQELLPPAGWNGVQNCNIVPNVPFVSVPESLPITFTGAQDPYMPPNSIANGQYQSRAQDQPHVSIPPGRQNSIPTAQDPSMVHDLASVSIPTSSQNPLANAQYSSVAETGPSVSISTNYLPYKIPGGQDPSMPQDGPSVSIPTSSQNPIASAQYHSMAQTRPSVSNPQNPITSMQGPSMPQNEPSVSIPTSCQNPIASTEYPSMAQAGPSVSVPTNPSNLTTSSHDPSMPQNGLKDKEIMHFIHPHNLSIINSQEDEENEITCSGCEETLVGKGYSCVEQKCNFQLHESCFHLKKEIQHKSHLEHPLTLLPRAPYNNKNGEFTCNACFSDGTGFTYHCSICKFDLHIQCVSLPETVKRADHKHTLKLLYSCPVKGEDYTLSCDVCHGDVQKDRWVYYCESCDYGTHLGCVDCEECERDSILDTQAQLQRLQLQMEMARQQAQLMASMGSSLASLVG